MCLITVIICSWLFIDRLNYLDIPSNKNEWYAMDAKRKINERTDIDECLKKLFQNQIDQDRKAKKMISAITSQTQIVALVLIFIQLVLLVFIFMMPRVKT